MHTPDPKDGAERADQPRTPPADCDSDPRPQVRRPNGRWRFLESEGRWAWVPAEPD
jgi:hypothetical protein